jgi:hypothetical protein
LNKIIEIIVSPKGETKLETKGFAGAECREASKFVEQALGVSAGEQMTAEFHESLSLGATAHIRPCDNG